MRKLPVFGVLGHAMRSVANNFRFAWYISWPWLAVMAPLGIAVESLMPAIDPQATDAAALARNAQAFLGYLALGVLSMFVFSSIAVSWHRYILKDVVPHGWARLRIDGVVWRYFGNTLLIFVLVVAASAPLVIVLSLLSVPLGLGVEAAGGLTMAVAGLFAIPLFYRLMLKLPAIAIENSGFTMKMALEKSVGASLQLCIAGAIVIASTLLMGLLLGGFASLLGAGKGGLGYFVATMLQQFVSWIVTIFTVTYLTSLYGFFVEGRDF
jgi:hypothetical protein